ncbi:putative reverse transcriptase zinc-binding domain-containing protein [Helianthus annuus]|nr:putative reverse transcriptase zinc-binding domain-containing protein [Helianthus annuus]
MDAKLDGALGCQKKVNILCWRLTLDRLPTRMALVRRGINISSSVCPLCCEVDESIDHLFSSCFVSSTVWQNISAWCGLSPALLFSTDDVLGMHNCIRNGQVKQKLVQCVVKIGCWLIWKHRNEVVFKSARVNIGSILDDLRTTGFLWIKNRSKLDIEWEQWVQFHFM